MARYFMTASTALFQIFVASQVWIYVSCLLMIVQDRTDEPNYHYLLPPDIYVVSGNHVINLTASYESLQVIPPTFNAHITYHTIIRYKHICTIDKRGYCSMHHYGIRWYKHSGTIDLHVIFMRGFIIAVVLLHWIHS